MVRFSVFLLACVLSTFYSSAYGFFHYSPTHRNIGVNCAKKGSGHPIKIKNLVVKMIYLLSWTWARNEIVVTTFGNFLFTIYLMFLTVLSITMRRSTIRMIDNVKIFAFSISISTK